MEVVSRLPDHENEGFSIVTVEHNTVAGLVRQVCKEHGIPMRTHYTLCDSRDQALQWSQTLANLGVKNGDTLYLCLEGTCTSLSSSSIVLKLHTYNVSHH